MRAALCLVCSGCVLSVRPLSDDFSDLPPEQALSQSLDRLEGVYSFTAWKGLDWAQIRTDLEAEADSASTDEDWARIYRRLALTMPDGHVSLWNDDADRDLCPEARGGLGLSFAELDDGSFLVDAVEAGGPAARAGVQAGDVLLDHGGESVGAALSSTPLYCSPMGLATNARRRAVQGRLLGRAPIGEVVSMTLADAGTVALVAEDDGATVRAVLSMPAPEVRIDHRMWTEDVGYIYLGWEETLLSERGFRQAVSSLWDDGARRLIVDLRNNDGGTDQTAANIVGTFYRDETFYETITMYDRRTASQAVISEVYVESQPLYWDLPVAVLINGNTVSSGEGIAMMMAPLDNVEIIGFEGTAASFGSAGSTIMLPGGWELSYPAGRSLDASGQIQLDSDDSLEGGVLPEHRVPWTAAHRLGDAADPVGYLVDLAAARLLGGAQ